MRSGLGLSNVLTVACSGNLARRGKDCKLQLFLLRVAIERARVRGPIMTWKILIWIAVGIGLAQIVATAITVWRTHDNWRSKP